MKRVILILVFIVVLAVVGAGWYYWGPVATPQGQPPLAYITPQTLEQLRAEFNAAANHPRIVALLSPT